MDINSITKKVQQWLIFLQQLETGSPTCQRYTYTMPSPGPSSPPSSPSGAQMPLPRTRTVCSITLAPPRRCLVEICHPSRSCTPPAGKLHTNLLRRSPAVHQDQNLMPQEHFICWQEKKRPKTPKRAHQDTQTTVTTYHITVRYALSDWMCTFFLNHWITSFSCTHNSNPLYFYTA